MNLFTHPMWFAFVAIQAMIPTLLIGPPGCGKTAANMALAGAMRRRYTHAGWLHPPR
jgi:MoxR-like ATPase